MSRSQARLFLFNLFVYFLFVLEAMDQFFDLYDLVTAFRILPLLGTWLGSRSYFTE